MPAAKKNPLTGYISLIGGLIPIIGVLLGMIVYVINLNSTISDNAKTLETLTAQLNNPAVKEFLEPNQYGETEMSNRLNGFECIPTHGEHVSLAFISLPSEHS